MSITRKWFKRGRFALAVTTLSITCFTVPGVASTVDGNLPADSDQLVATIRQAIEDSSYEQLEELVFWKGAGKIKKRIIRFQLNRNLGRPVKSIAFEDFPVDGMAALEATGKLEANMQVTNKVRVVFDEDPINDAGKLPTTVFVVGKKEGVYRIALVVRTGIDDDDD